MTAYSGRDFLLQINTGTTYLTVGGMRTTEMTLNNQLIDTSNKASGSWRHLLTGAGIRSMRLAAAGVFENSDAETTVRAAAFSGTALDAKLLFGNGDSITGLFLLAAYERSGIYDREETYSITLESAGDITFTAAS